MNADEKEDNELLYGVSLAHLAQLPIPYAEGFRAASEFVKAKTRSEKVTTGSQSYAQWLKSNESTQHLVRDQATVFVSCAWGGGFGKTMEALTTHFKSQLEETFVWMDFAIVDQHKSSISNNNKSADDDIREWTNVFGNVLSKIGKAVLVLTPIRNPLVATRSWSCLELTTIIRTNTPFSYCVPFEEEQSVINDIYRGLSLDDFYSIFSNVNVQMANASKLSDEQAINHIVGRLDIVNDLVLKCMKEWFMGVVKKAENNATWATMEMTRILNSRAALHLAMGELEASFLYYEKALDCAKSIPNNDIEISIQLSNFAALLRERGEYEAAELLDRESLELSKRLLGENHPDVATSMNNLAVSLVSKGDYEAAEPLLIEALNIRRSILKDQPRQVVDVAESLHNLAGLLDDKGEYERAEPLYRESLTMYKDCLGENHSTVATSMNNLALLLMNRKCQDNEEEAELLLRQSLGIRRRALGEEHPDVASSLNNLAGLMKEKGEKKEAEILFQQSLEIKLRVYNGNQHPSVANTMHHLATLMKERGDVERAEQFYRDALLIRKRFLGEDHPSAATSLHSLAKLLFQDKQDLIEAERLFRDALDIFKSAFGPNHPSCAATLYHLAKLLEANHRLEEAIPYGLEAYSVALERFGPKHPNTIQYSHWKHLSQEQLNKAAT